MQLPHPRAPNPTQDDLEIDKILNREASAFQREIEVTQVRTQHLLLANLIKLGTCSISPYDILDIQETVTGEEIKKKYRQISLCA